MQITSLAFLLFFIIVVFVFYAVPANARTIVLLIASIVFYASVDYRCVLVLVAVIGVSYLGAGLICSCSQRTSKVVLGVFVAVHILILIYFKYTGFLTGGRWKSILAPIGVSFITFVAIGFLVDVFRDNNCRERNIIKHALLISFFPAVLSGPIERGKHFLTQLDENRLRKLHFDIERIRDGFLRILWGFFLKLVVADRIAIFVDSVYSQESGSGGAVTFLTILLYSMQIYCDFGGYTEIALGVSHCFGIQLLENFNTPYLSESIADFWRRWHMSLSSWLRDYVYIPLGGNRKGTVRKYINILIVFMISGIWHGVGFGFIVWGMIHGVLQVVGGILKPIRLRVRDLLKIDENSFSLKGVRIAITFILVSFAWVFFRMETLESAVAVIGRLTEPRLWQMVDGTLFDLGLDRNNVILLILSLVVVIVVDILKYRGISGGKWLKKQRLWIRWPIYFVIILLVAVMGIWGAGFDSSSFIYYKF